MRWLPRPGSQATEDMQGQIRKEKPPGGAGLHWRRLSGHNEERIQNSGSEVGKFGMAASMTDAMALLNNGKAAAQGSLSTLNTHISGYSVWPRKHGHLLRTRIDPCLCTPRKSGHNNKGSRTTCRGKENRKHLSVRGPKTAARRAPTLSQPSRETIQLT